MFNMIKNLFKGWFQNDDESQHDHRYIVEELSKKMVKKLKLPIETKRAKHYLAVKDTHDNENIKFLYVLTNTMPNIWKSHDMSSESLLKINEVIEIDLLQFAKTGSWEVPKVQTYDIIWDGERECGSCFDISESCNLPTTSNVEGFQQVTISITDNREVLGSVINWLKKNNPIVQALLTYDQTISGFGYALGYTQISCNKKPRTVIRWNGKIYDNKLIYQTSKKDGQLTKLALHLKHALEKKRAKYETTETIFGYIINIHK